MLKVAGTKQEVVEKLFVIDGNGKVVFSAMPTAISNNAFSPEELFNDWYEFRDYIMEGYVNYQIRFEEQGNAVEMFIKLSGTPKDPYIMSALKFYVEAAGLNIVA